MLLSYQTCLFNRSFIDGGIRLLRVLHKAEGDNVYNDHQDNEQDQGGDALKGSKEVVRAMDHHCDDKSLPERPGGTGLVSMHEQIFAFSVIISQEHAADGMQGDGKNGPENACAEAG